MNLQNVAAFAILIWLPLTSPEALELRNDAGFHYSMIGERAQGGNGASRASPTKISANSEIPDEGRQPTRGQPLKSALHAISNIINGGNAKWGDASAAVDLPGKNESKTRSKHSREWIRKRKRRKKRYRVKGPRSRRQRFASEAGEEEQEEDEYEDEENSTDDDDDEVNLDEIEDVDDGNSTELGRYVGSPCEATCNAKLLHVFCEPNNHICECEKKYPVQIGPGRGCAKPKQLGDQCFYAQTCSFTDPNAICTQINHNAICQCKPGFHSVALRRGSKKSFCSEDQVVVSTDLPTLFGVATGIAVLTGLICFVLKLFNNNRFPDRRRYNNANIAPPLLFSSDNQWINGIPLTVHGRPSSRTSSQRSTTNLAHYSRSKGVLVPASRAGAARAAAILLIPCHLQAKQSDSEVASRRRNDESDAQEIDKENFSRPGSRRPSISSIKSTTSSQKSMTYSARRFEQENQQREARAAMRTAREEAARIAAPPTPSPLSTDELLPALEKVEDDPPRIKSLSATSIPEENEKSSPILSK